LKTYQVVIAADVPLFLELTVEAKSAEEAEAQVQKRISDDSEFI
jgi:hypothetical protein